MVRFGERLSLAWKIYVTGKKKKLKKLFRKEAFRFCQSFWEEQKASQQFTFNEYNKDII